HTLDPDRFVAARSIALAHAEGETAFVVLAVPHKAVIHFDLAREEKLVRRREDGNAAGPAFSHGQPVARDEWHGVAVGRAAEFVPLWIAARIVPSNTLERVEREAAHPRRVLVGH